MQQKTYRHRHLKVEIGDVLIGEVREIKSFMLLESDGLERITKILDALRALEAVGEWWVEETSTTVVSWSAEEVEGRYARGGVCRCGHSRSDHNPGDGYFGTSCFHKDGHDVYCDCQAFKVRK